MSSWWSAGEFRRVRMVAVMATAVGWGIAFLTDGGCPPPECGPNPFRMEDVVFATVFAGVIHLGLLLSFVAERGGAVVRLSGMALMIPSALLAIKFARYTLLYGGRADAPNAALVVAYGLAHFVQVWALTGIPFPRLAPTAGSHRDTEAQRGT